MSARAFRGTTPMPTRPRTHRLPFRLRATGLLALAALASSAVVVGCDDTAGPGMILSISVSPSDATIFAGDSLQVDASVEYETGTGTPDSVAWSISDPAVLALEVLPGGGARVTGLERGAAYAIATVDDAWVDSAAVEVVRPGDVRWIADVGGNTQNHTALDQQGRIYIVNGDGPGPPLPGMLYSLLPDGSQVLAEPTCFSFYAPTLLADGTAYTTGIDCSMTHGPDGAVKWTLPFGSIEGAIAVAADGSAALLHNEDSDTAGFTVLSWITPSGDEAWRDTLGVTRIGLIQENPVAIAANGDIYAPWQESYSPHVVHLSRVTPDGSTRWTVPLSAADGLEGQTPAPLGDRVVVSYNLGLAVYDTSGTLLWDDATTERSISSPVVDEEGNIFIQGSDALRSYDPTGSLRWSADSLAYNNCFNAAPPTLLEQDQLVVPCGLTVATREMCAVDANDGSLIWRTAIEGFPYCGSPAVSPDGTIYTTFVLSGERRLVALWNDVPPLREGWPTEGGDMARTRSR